MAEVKLVITGEDKASSVFSAVDNAMGSVVSRINEMTGVIRANASAVDSANSMWEAAFNKLGVSSNAAIEAEKRAIQSALNVVRSMSDSPAEIARAVAAANTQIARLDSKLNIIGNSSQKMANQTSTALERCKEGFVSFYFKAQAAAEIISRVFEFAKIGAATVQIEASFARVAASMGENADLMMEKMKEAANGAVDDSDIMQRAIKGMTQGISGDQLVQLMAVARNQAQLTGNSIINVFDAITNAVANQMPRSLKTEAGLIIDTTDAYKKYADAHKLSVGSMTEMQQSQALLNAVLEEGQRKMKMTGEATETAAEIFQKAEAALNDIKETLGKIATGALLILAGSVSALGVVVMGAASAFFKLGEGIFWVLSKLPLIGDGFEESATAARKLADDTMEMAGKLGANSAAMFKGIPALINPAADAARGLGQADKDAAEAAAKLAAENEKMSKITPAFDKLSEDISAIVSPLSDSQKEIAAFTDRIMELGKQLNDLPTDKATEMAKKLSEMYEQGMAALKNKHDSEFKNMIQSELDARKTGVDKDLVIVDKWLADVVKKYGDSEENMAAITDLYGKKRADIRKKWEDVGKDVEQKTKDNLAALGKTQNQNPYEQYEAAIIKLNYEADVALRLENPAETIKELQRIQGEWAKLNTAVTDGERVWVTQDDAIQSAAINIEYLGFKMKELVNTETDKVKPLELDSNPALEAIDRVKDAWNNWTPEDKTFTIHVDGVGSPRLPIGEKLEWLNKQLGNVKSDSNFTVDFSSFTQILGMYNEMAIKAAKLADYNAALGGLGVPVHGGSQNEMDAYRTSADMMMQILLRFMPQGSYASGTSYVPRTGNYILHAGEEVRPVGKRSYDAGGRSQGGDRYSVTLSPTIMLSGGSGGDPRRQAVEIDRELAVLIKSDRSKVAKEIKRFNK